MAALYRIKDWEDNFEVAQNKSVKKWSWVALPLKHDGRGYRRIMSLKDGLEVYGAWVLIVAVAAKCTPRGTLADERGPMTAEDLWLKTGCPAAKFERAIEVVCSKEVAWMLIDDSESAMSALSLQDRTVHNPTEQNNKSAPDESGCPPELRAWLAWWNRLRAESLVDCGVDSERPSQAVLKGWSKVERTPELRKLLEDRDAIVREVRESPLCREGWFRLEKLFGGKNRDGEYIVRKLLEGGYRSKKALSKPEKPPLFRFGVKT